MIKPHIFLDGERRYEASMHAVPRVGDTLRFHGEIYGKVTEVIWCLDENNLKEQRVNIRVESEFPSSTPPRPEPEAEPVAWIHCQGEDYEELHTWSLTPECVSVGWTQYPLYRHPPKPEPARKPMTDEEMEKQYEIDKEYFGESVMRAFYNGVRFAEKHHGIGRGME